MSSFILELEVMEMKGMAGDSTGFAVLLEAGVWAASSLYALKGETEAPRRKVMLLKRLPPHRFDARAKVQA